MNFFQKYDDLYGGIGSDATILGYMPFDVKIRVFRVFRCKKVYSSRALPPLFRLSASAVDSLLKKNFAMSEIMRTFADSE